MLNHLFLDALGNVTLSIVNTSNCFEIQRFYWDLFMHILS